MTNPTSSLLSLAGGALIGSTLVLVAALTGRSLGVSGMAAALLRGDRGDRRIASAFLGGMLAAGAVLGLVAGDFAADATTRPALAFLAGGVLVGWGARHANGCTSGHGILGISRSSTRSIVATVLFGLGAALVVAAWPGGGS